MPPLSPPFRRRLQPSRLPGEPLGAARGRLRMEIRVSQVGFPGLAARRPARAVQLRGRRSDDPLELPVHGWPDAASRRAAAPTPEKELAVHAATITAACGAGLPYCCLALRADSTIRPQDPEARIAELLIDHAAEEGLALATLDELAAWFPGQDPTPLTAPRCRQAGRPTSNPVPCSPRWSDADHAAPDHAEPSPSVPSATSRNRR